MIWQFSPRLASQNLSDVAYMARRDVYGNSRPSENRSVADTNRSVRRRRRPPSKPPVPKKTSNRGRNIASSSSQSKQGLLKRLVNSIGLSPKNNHNRRNTSLTDSKTPPPRRVKRGKRPSQRRVSVADKPRLAPQSVRSSRPTGPYSSKSKVSGSPRPQRPSSPLIYTIRLLILGFGIGAIAGTLLSALDPATYLARDSHAADETTVEQPSNETTLAPVIMLSQEMAALKEKIQALAAPKTQLTPGVFIVDLDTGAYVDIEGSTVFSAASMIKVPILIAFFQDVDEGKVRLDEMLTMTEDVIGGGSGNMQYQQPGTKFSALDTATRMIVISDNTATNMIIERLGGAESLNSRFYNWGLTSTVIRNPLPDLEGTNTTSPKDLADLMAMVNQGQLVSLRSRDRLLHIMRQTKTNTLLPRGLGKDATIAHKTGDIGSLVGDVGLIDMPSGKRYLAAVMMKRPHNDPQAQELIRQISREVYNYLEQPPVPVIPSPSPTPSPRSTSGSLLTWHFGLLP
ncbi:MAG: serine hydrolase [Cyanobacteriota bacterium]